MAEAIETSVVPELVVLNKGDFPIESVVVYFDRAEISRRIKWSPAKQILVDLKIPNLGNEIMPESLRVQNPGTGTMTLKEVSMSSEPLAKAQKWEDHAEVKKLLQELETLTDVHLKLLSKDKSIARMIQGSQKFIDCLISNNKMNSERTTAENDLPVVSRLVSGEMKTVLKKTRDFLALGAEQEVEYAAESAGVHKDLAKLREQIDVVKARLTQLTGHTTPPKDPLEDLDAWKVLMRNPGQVQFSQCAHILLALKEGSTSEIELVVSYHVRASSWQPSYDLRLNGSDSEKDGDSDVELNYFGSVKQSTSEPWVNAIITLATAQPATFGAPPPLPSLSASFFVPQPVHPVPAHYGHVTRGVGMPNHCLMAMQATPVPEALPFQKSMDVDTMGSHASYVIPGRHTIPADGEGHKVTIAMVKSKAKNNYYSTPEVSNKVYLSTSFENESEYLLIPSQSVSVFFGSSFLTKTAMKRVAPGEKMDVFVGEDPRVVMETKPLQKFRKSQGGMITSKTFKDTYEMFISFKNTRASLVDITFVLRQPRSTDEKIKVIPITPDKWTEVSMPNDNNIFCDSKYLEQNPNGTQIVWFMNQDTRNLIGHLTVDKGTTKSLKYSYELEFPQDKVLVVSENR